MACPPPDAARNQPRARRWRCRAKQHPPPGAVGLPRERPALCPHILGKGSVHAIPASKAASRADCALPPGSQAISQAPSVLRECTQTLPARAQRCWEGRLSHAQTVNVVRMAKGDNSPPPAVDDPVPMARPPVSLSRQQTQSQLAPRRPRGPEGRTGAEHPLPHIRAGQAQTGWKQGHPASSEHPERPEGCHSTMESGPHRPLASPSFLQTRGTSLPEGHGLATDAP